MVVVYVDVDPWEAIEEIELDQLAEYMRENDYFVSKSPSGTEPLERTEIQFLMDNLDTSKWEQQRIYDKLSEMRFIK